MSRSLVIDHIENRSKGVSDHVAFVYFETATRQRQTADLVLRALLIQFVARIKPEDFTVELKSLYHNFALPGRSPEIPDLLSAIESISGKPLSKYIVFDGLDECSDDERETFFEEVLPQLTKLFRIFVTARFDPKEPSFPSVLCKSLTLEIEARSADVDKMLTERLKVSKLDNRTLEERIKREIKNATGGM